MYITPLGLQMKSYPPTHGEFLRRPLVDLSCIPEDVIHVKSSLVSDVAAWFDRVAAGADHLI